MLEGGGVEAEGIPAELDGTALDPVVGQGIGAGAFEDVGADGPLVLGGAGGEIDIPLAVDEVDFRSPDVGSHGTAVVFAPDDLGLGGGEAPEGAGAAQLDAVVFGDGGGEVIPAVGVEENVRIGALREDGVDPGQGLGGIGGVRRGTAVGGLDATQLGGGERQHGAMAESEGEGDVGGGLEATAREVAGDEGLVAFAFGVVVEEEAPFGGTAGGGGRKLIAKGALVARSFGEREPADLGPRTGEQVGAFLEDRACAQVFREAVVATVLADDRGVDDGEVALDEDKGLAEGDEVPGAGGPDAVFGEVVALVHGGPIDEVVAVLLVVDGFGGPGAAGVVRRDFDEARLGPLHEVGGLPDDDGKAAGVGGAFPVVVEQVDREIGGEEVELFAVVRTQEKGIAHAFLAELADEHGLAVVEGGPIASVAAGGEINLFVERGVLVPERHEKMAAGGSERGGQDGGREREDGEQETGEVSCGHGGVG